MVIVLKFDLDARVAPGVQIHIALAATAGDVFLAVKMTDQDDEAFIWSFREGTELRGDMD